MIVYGFEFGLPLVVYFVSKLFGSKCFSLPMVFVVLVN